LSFNSKELGLGLSIVKRIAELLPMDIEIFSETGKGTKVVLSFR
jgi:signal transduction histidine kinase